MSIVWVMVGAALVVLVALGVVQVASLAAGRSFLTTVILGEDQRTSTSKTFILMWTLLVAWALVALLIAGELTPLRDCVTGTLSKGEVRCSADAFGRLQLGWQHFLHSGLAGSYLVLLGIPASAGVAAKGITQSQVQNATAVKTKKAPGSGGLVSRFAEIFSADDGSTDIADFQYMIFNLITATYFVARFLRPDVNGLPVIPDTLLGLTGVSASLYVGKKAVARSQPVVSGVFPSILRAGQQFTVVGTGLIPDPGAVPVVDARITIDGVPASGVAATAGGNLSGNVPPGLGAPGGGSVSRQLQVLTPYGALTTNFTVLCM